MVCAGGEEGCTARQRWCLCGVLACADHGHTAYGDDFYGAYLNLRADDEDWDPPPLRVVQDIDLGLQALAPVILLLAGSHKKLCDGLKSVL
jgi:hypothetical protein